jgi:peptide/nickel transport system permease protein
VLRFIARRALFAVLVIIAVQVIVFAITHALGSPARLMLPATATAEEVARLDSQLGYDRPWWEQLIELLLGSAVGDFGMSYWQRIPAGEVVFSRLPATLILVLLSMILAVAISIPLGVFAAMRRGTGWDRVIVTASLVGVSMPAFWLGYLLIILFAVQLHWLPTSGSSTPAHYILPVITLAALPIGRITQIVRSSMLGELGQQYMLVGASLGLPRVTRIYKHALKNAGIPILTMTGWEISRLISGFTVLVEVVFAWPGIGQLSVQAIAHRDIPLLVASVTVVAGLIVVLNLLLDIGYSFLDPRVRTAARVKRTRPTAEAAR